MREFLDLENMEQIYAGQRIAAQSSLFISLNPDLITDIGHYYNYEKRMRERCLDLGWDYLCFANSEVAIDDDWLWPVFQARSGDYALVVSSARGREAVIGQAFASSVRGGVQRLQDDKTYERVVIFMYCGSSLLAYKLSQHIWPSNTSIVINSFWDFLLPVEMQKYEHLAVIRSHSTVHVLAMSDLHREEIYGSSGYEVDHIPNPSPLLDDATARATLLSQVAQRPSRQGTCVFIPGLMTSGKGAGFTRQLIKAVRSGAADEFRFIVRDRGGEFERESVRNMEFVTGDLSEAAVCRLYETADFAILPYEEEVFALRTSGALVDCMMFGVVPVVAAGTWLAHTCTKHCLGVVLQEMSVESAIEAIRRARCDMREAMLSTLSGGARYLAANSWAALIMSVTREQTRLSLPCTQETMSSRSLFSEANRLYKEGNYWEAATITKWLGMSQDSQALDPFSRAGHPDLGHRHPGIPYSLAEHVIWRYPGLAAYVVRRHPRVAEMYRQMRDRGIPGHLRANYPTLMHLGRFAGWSLAVLKRTLLGIGGIALLVVLGLLVAAALVPPLRWHLVGIATLLLLMCGGVLALSYLQSVLNRLAAEQRQITEANTVRSRDNRGKVLSLQETLDDLKESLRASEAKLAELKREISHTNNTVAEMREQLGEREKKI